MPGVQRDRKLSPKPAGAVPLAMLVLLFVCFLASCAGVALAEESWLKIEEEKPLSGDSAPRPETAPAPGKPAPKDEPSPQKAKLQRYLDRFTQAIARAQQCVDDRGDSLKKHAAALAKIGAANTEPAIGPLKETLKTAVAGLDKYEKLLKKDPRFTPVDPGQNADIRTKGDELIKIGGRMCGLAKQWAKTTGQANRDGLKKELDQLRQETKRKRAALKDGFNSMISLLKPIYSGLGGCSKKLTPEMKQVLNSAYEAIIRAVLEAHDWREKMGEKKTSFDSDLQKALEAASAVKDILYRNPKLLSEAERNNILQKISSKRTTSQLKNDYATQQEKLKTRQAKSAEACHAELAKDPGIPMVKVALAGKTLALIYSASGDTYSRGVKDAFEAMQRTKETLAQIKERKRFMDLEWERSGKKLTESWVCVNKWLKQKAKRYFSGTLEQTFSAAVIKLYKPCASKKITCGPVRAAVGATYYVKNRQVCWRAGKVPMIKINAPTPRGLYCGANQNNETGKQSSCFRVDPATGSLFMGNNTIYSVKGKLSGNTLNFEMFRKSTFDTDNKGCGHMSTLVHTKAGLKEVAGEGVNAATEIDTAGELEPLAGRQGHQFTTTTTP